MPISIRRPKSFGKPLKFILDQIRGGPAELKMMMRLLRSTVANKSCRMGRLQYRGFSSADVTTTRSTTMGKKIVEYCYKGAFLGVGYVLGGVTSPPVSKQVQEVEESLIRDEKFLDEQEAKINNALSIYPLP